MLALWSFFMGIDLQLEEVYSFAKAARLIPPARNGKRTHISTLLRWATKGAKGPDGTIVRLDAMRLGGRWVTSRQALERFMAALTPRPAGRGDTPGARTPASRQGASERAAAELDGLRHGAGVGRPRLHQRHQGRHPEVDRVGPGPATG